MFRLHSDSLDTCLARKRYLCLWICIRTFKNMGYINSQKFYNSNSMCWLEYNASDTSPTLMTEVSMKQKLFPWFEYKPQRRRFLNRAINQKKKKSYLSLWHKCHDHKQSFFLHMGCRSYQFYPIILFGHNLMSANSTEFSQVDHTLVTWIGTVRSHSVSNAPKYTP